MTTGRIPNHSLEEDISACDCNYCRHKGQREKMLRVVGALLLLMVRSPRVVPE